VLVLTAAAASLLALVTFRVGSQPVAEIVPAQPGIGRSTPVEVRARAGGRGLADLRLVVRQGQRSVTLLDKRYESRPPLGFWGERTIEDRQTVVVGSETVADLEQGDAILTVEVSTPGTWLRSGPRATVETTLPVLLRPPTLSVVSSQHYPTQGGCEVVVYRAGSTATRDGVSVGSEWFPGFPVPDAEGLRFALFAVPFDHATADDIRLEAEDAVGNTASVSFVDKFFPRDFKRDRIAVSETFMSKVVPEIQANTPGLESGPDLVADYVRINSELRERNARTMRELAEDSAPAFLWQGPFQALPNAQVMSDFADRRTYTVDGAEIDRQDHLGFDLASVQRAEVPAANGGRVVMAEYFGIYGNAVVVDHGYGLMSLYGHLSSIDVEVGEEVMRGAILGRTGQTGLAAGDHLHFTMLLQGVAVNPIEWWDGKWIRDRLGRKLGSALPGAS
jgi:murein DD-endopeptidase MepM/ murein hydrolase activator NlpD